MSNTGEKIRDAFKGVINATNGAGETVRGKINQTFDNLGDSLQNHKAASKEAAAQTAQDDSKPDHEQVAKSGLEQLSKGISQITSSTGNASK